MLGPQGPVEPKRISDPKLVSTYEIPSSLAANIFRFVLGLLLVAGCAWAVVTPSDKIFDRVVLGLCGAFFGYVVLVRGQLILRHKPPIFTREGLTLDVLGTRKLVKWSDIAETKIWKYRTTRTNVIVLVDARPFAAQFSAEEMRSAIRDEQVSNFAGVMVGLFAPGGASPPDDVSKFERLLALRRKRYGGEIFLPSADRDRPAEEFNALIEEWKATYR